MKTGWPRGDVCHAHRQQLGFCISGVHRKNCQMPGAELPGQGRLPWLSVVLAAAVLGEVLMQQVSLDWDGLRSLPC